MNVTLSAFFLSTFKTSSNSTELGQRMELLKFKQNSYCNSIFYKLMGINFISS